MHRVIGRAICSGLFTMYCASFAVHYVLSILWSARFVMVRGMDELSMNDMALHSSQNPQPSTLNHDCRGNGQNGQRILNPEPRLQGEWAEDEHVTRGVCALVHASCMSWGAMVTAVVNCKAVELLLDHCSSAIVRYGRREDSEGDMREIKGPGSAIDVREGWITIQWCVDALCVLMMSEESHEPFTAADGAR